MYLPQVTIVTCRYLYLPRVTSIYVTSINSSCKLLFTREDKHELSEQSHRLQSPSQLVTFYSP